jgi:hypothetical protein
MEMKSKFFWKRAGKEIEYNLMTCGNPAFFSHDQKVTIPTKSTTASNDEPQHAHGMPR